MKKRKKARRSEVKNPGLKKQYNSKIKQEYLDYDYLHKLSAQELEMLNKFTEEFYGAVLDVENLDNNLHNTTKLKKDCQDRNNARNRCIYGLMRATNRLLPSTVYTTVFDKDDDESVK